MQPASSHMLICILLAWSLSLCQTLAPTPKTTEVLSINISHLPLITCSLKDHLFPETLGFLLSVTGSCRRDHPTLVHTALQTGSLAGTEVLRVSTDAYLLNMWMCSALCEALSIHEVGECYTHFTDGETEAPQQFFFLKVAHQSQVRLTPEPLSLTLVASPQCYSTHFCILADASLSPGHTQTCPGYIFLPEAPDYQNWLQLGKQTPESLERAAERQIQVLQRERIKGRRTR